MSKPKISEQQSAEALREKSYSKKRILLSTIGSRGDVQPILALALQLQRLGHHPVLCVPPNFKDWAISYGIECIPIGPDLQNVVRPNRGTKRRVPASSRIQQLLQASVVEQFAVMSVAADSCDLIVVAGGLQHAGRSIAEKLNIPYVHVSYCPVTLKSRDHPPPTLRLGRMLQNLPKWINRLLWRKSERQWNSIYRDVLNEQRRSIGLAPVEDVPAYITTEQPWLVADRVIAPIPATTNVDVVQTGAWFLEDTRPLPANLETFLASGEPPVCFGFGSMRTNENSSRIIIEAARRLGRRAIISQGWGNLDVIDSGVDCIAVGDISYEQLLPRVSCIVHHGGAGTTTAAVRAGIPQVVAPHIYDQYYWANRIVDLGVGVAAGSSARLTVDKLVSALNACLASDMAEQAKLISGEIELQGVSAAVERIEDMICGD